MTSLFLIMLVLFDLVIVLIHNRMKDTEEERREIKNFLKRHHDRQYLLIIEGQASRGIISTTMA